MGATFFPVYWLRLCKHDREAIVFCPISPAFALAVKFYAKYSLHSLQSSETKMDL